ncbi:hypothetical protein [Vulcanisaeta sp. JCM 16159]|uniref:hypothetical protein n=1 Tax=Vulcanisaeta sp. JCM 16159 TaxID=1295371 RepID=UPI000ADED85A|nr:hypothetical protein [Vulcanisaeta sp. JCM 16159]
MLNRARDPANAPTQDAAVNAPSIISGIKFPGDCSVIQSPTHITGGPIAYRKH